jgi:hypothetical protein
MSTGRASGPGRDVVLVASGDSRLAANQRCWPARGALETAVEKAFADSGARVVRGHPFDPVKKHGFIGGQASGRDAAARIFAGEKVPHEIVPPTLMITKENALPAAAKCARPARLTGSGRLR